MIAIPNMERPTNCIDCIAHRLYDHDEYFWYDSNYCKALGKCFNKDKLDIDPFKQILPDCPLIEIADDVWENEKYKLIRMTEEARINKAMAERRNDD